MPRYEFDVDVVYTGIVTVSADNPAEAEAAVRRASKPQAVFNDRLLGAGNTYDTDMTPSVHFHHMKEIPQ